MKTSTSMSENTKNAGRAKIVNNPLLVIGLFISFSEAAGAIVLAQLDKALQPTFLWFLMGFPSLVALLFFITLNFNPKVLYAPGDFRDEANFIKAVLGDTSNDIGKINIELEKARDHIIKEVMVEISSANEAERKRLSEIVFNKITSIQTQLSLTQNKTQAVISSVTNTVSTPVELSAAIMDFFSRDNMKHEKSTADFVAKTLGFSVDDTHSTLDKLTKKGLLRKTFDDDSGDLYSRPTT